MGLMKSQAGDKRWGIWSIEERRRDLPKKQGDGESIHSISTFGSVPFFACHMYLYKGKTWILVLLVVHGVLLQHVKANNQHGAEIEDNDFAEFEDFDDEEPVHEEAADGGSRGQRVVMAPEATGPEADVADDDDATVEEEDDEFEHRDEEEFEGFDKRPPGKPAEKTPELKITKVPLLRTNWDSFYIEMLMLAGLGVYFLNFLAGKSKNSRLAQSWFSHHKELLESNFSLVGDDGTSSEPQNGVLMKESENMYSLWCSGRSFCDGMLVTLKLLKRQDIINTIARIFRPASDQIIVKVDLDIPENADRFVFCVANRKVAGKMFKDMVDLNLLTDLKKSVDRLPACYNLMSEIHEASMSLLDSKVQSILSQHEDMVEFIHISDQYTGVKAADDSQENKVTEPSHVLICCFNVPGQGKCSPADMKKLDQLMKLIFYLLGRVASLHLSRESQMKSRKNRTKIQEIAQKANHQQRAEAAQARKEERRRAEKDRIMAETDPDKQRRLEEKNNKKEAKKKQPRMKTMKVKMS